MRIRYEQVQFFPCRSWQDPSSDNSRRFHTGRKERQRMDADRLCSNQTSDECWYGQDSCTFQRIGIGANKDCKVSFMMKDKESATCLQFGFTFAHVVSTLKTYDNLTDQLMQVQANGHNAAQRTSSCLSTTRPRCNCARPLKAKGRSSHFSIFTFIVGASLVLLRVIFKA